MRRIIYVLGATCVGKSTLLELAAKFTERVGLVQVGKELRKRYPPEHFHGQGAPAHTQVEAESIFFQQLRHGWDHGRTIMLVDGQPRSLNQVETLLNVHDAEEEAWWVHAPDRHINAWMFERFKKHPAGFDLAKRRTTNDRVSLYPIIHRLLLLDFQVTPVHMTDEFDYDKFFKDQCLVDDDAA